MELAHTLWKAQQTEQDRLVFLHGMGGTGVLWRPIAASLEDHYSIMAPDQRAHGRSRETQKSYRPEDFGQDLIDTMEALSFHPAWVVGHSMGVRSAVAAAHLKPEWIQGLVLIDLGFAGPAGGGLGDELASFLKKLPLKFASRNDAREYMNRECPDPSMGQYLMAVSVINADKTLTFPFDRDGLIHTLEAVRDTSIRPWLEELGKRGMPVLALRGGDSRVWSKTDFEMEASRFRSYPSIRFREVPGTGHGLPFEKRQEFVNIVLEFISGAHAGL